MSLLAPRDVNMRGALTLGVWGILKVLAGSPITSEGVHFFICLSILLLEPGMPAQPAGKGAPSDLTGAVSALSNPSDTALRLDVS